MNWIKQQVANVAGTQEPIYGPSAIQSVAEQAKTVPWTELKKEDLKWTTMNSTSVETQTFYFTADSGHIGMAQVIYSNVAGIHTTVQFNSKIFYPDRNVPPLWCSDALDNSDFDPDRYSFHADGCAITLNPEGTAYTIKSVVNEDTIVNVTISQSAPGFHVGKDGKSYFGTDPANPWGSMRHAFWPRCHVEGSFITKEATIDFKGRGFFVHALQGMKPHHAAARWNFVDFQSPTYSAVMMEYTTPPSYGSTVVNVGGIVVDGKILFAGSGNQATHVKAKQDTENDWPEPEEVKFTWNGESQDGKKVTAIIEGNFGRRLDRIDVMAKVPGFIKTIVGGVAGTKPYIYQYSPRPKLSMKVSVDGEETVEEGELFSEATFIS